MAKAQQMKMELFAGFKRSAVVIVPTYENLRKRIGEKRPYDVVDVPFMALANMKCKSPLTNCWSYRPGFE